MELVIESDRFLILSDWVDRWQFLKDYRDEIGNNVTWTYTDKTSLHAWIQLNQNMDYYTTLDYSEDVRRLSHQEEENVERSHTAPINQFGSRFDPFYVNRQELNERTYIPRLEELGSRPLAAGPSQKKGDALPIKTIPLSSLYSIIEYMNPTSSRYLLYVEIDSLLLFNRRKTAYRQLGEYVVKSCLTPWGREYIGEKSEDSEWNINRLVFSAFLYSTPHPDNLTEKQVAELLRLRTLIRKDPLIDLFGILRSCSQTYGVEAYMSVNWEDVKTIVFSQEALLTHAEVMRIYQSDEQGPSDPINVFRRNFFQTSRGLPTLLGDAPASLLFMAKIPLPSIRDLSQTDPMLDSDTQLGKNITLDQVVSMASFQASNCDTVQVARVAGRMLGMELVLIQKNVGPGTPFWSRPGVYNLLNWKVLDVFAKRKLRSPTVRNYKKVCQTLADELGVAFLTACAEALLRLIEYWDSRPEELAGTDLIYGTGERDEKIQRKRILSLVEAILPLIE